MPPLYHTYFQQIAIVVFKSCQAIFDLRLPLWFLLLDPRSWQEGSYEIGSVFPSVRLPYSILILTSVGKFSWNWLISFFWNLVWCWGPIFSYILQSQMFLKKNGITNGRKGPKNKVFWLFKKIKSLVLYGIGLKQKFLWSFNILQKLHAWEKSRSQVGTKNGCWPMRFQYSLIVNVSLVAWYLTSIFGM